MTYRLRRSLLFLLVVVLLPATASASPRHNYKASLSGTFKSTWKATRACDPSSADGPVYGPGSATQNIRFRTVKAWGLEAVGGGGTFKGKKPSIQPGGGRLRLAVSEARQSNLRRCQQPGEPADPPNQCGTRKGRGYPGHGIPPFTFPRTMFQLVISWDVDWYNPEVYGDVCPLTGTDDASLPPAVLSDLQPKFRTRKLLSHRKRRHVFRRTGKGRFKPKNIYGGDDGRTASYSFSYKFTLVRTR